ncbi:MAG: hypothetical protein ONA69_02680, partial [candidate division KSB1 bacterium]|nr:hypothetical protein [candidate division KSB1 bacterium]
MTVFRLHKHNFIRKAEKNKQLYQQPKCPNDRSAGDAEKFYSEIKQNQIKRDFNYMYFGRDVRATACLQKNIGNLPRCIKENAYGQPLRDARALDGKFR